MNRSFTLLRSIAPLSFCLLAACNASTTASTDSATTDYETFNSTANTTSTLGGAAVKLRENPDVVTVSSSSGTLDHSTGATVLDDGTYRLEDQDGFGFDTLLTDGISVLIATPTRGFSDSYSYARVYTQGYLVGTTPYSATGVFGIVTSDADIPTSGSATYTGEAVGNYSDGTTDYDLDDGSSTVVANFGTGTVNVTMEGFEAVNRSNGNTEDVGFNQVTITGMSIDGNQFDGGTIATLADGTVVTIIGAQSQSDAIGRFFGLDSDGVPDEVGGVGYIEGADGSVTTIFLAD
ncbi:transferrin-binding protein-like solute binding protein [Planktotalea sp.]|uniref:transferrin-binding protein-like solute binding protein n=1 Tax=Planktotalea sp. TaxID=2029877 RepID=UPI003298DF0C